MARPMGDAVGIDIGGTNVRVADVAADGTVLDVRRAPTPFGDAETLVKLVAELVGDRTGPVGVGIAGGVTADGTLRGAPNLGLDGAPIGGLLEDALGRGVTITNDANAATWAEYRLGAGRDVQHLLLLTLGTGVGGGAVIDGALLRGATGLAAEFGHVIVHEGGAPCACGNRGCLEAYASGTVMAMGERSASVVAAEARNGDEDAIAHLASVGTWVGVGLAALVAVLDPARIVLGGGAGEAAFDQVAPAARAALAERLFARGRREPPPVVAAELGDRAGVAGAALLALEEVGP